MRKYFAKYRRVPKIASPEARTQMIKNNDLGSVPKIAWPEARNKIIKPHALENGLVYQKSLRRRHEPNILRTMNWTMF